MIRRRFFKFRPIQVPPDKYFLTTREVAGAQGITIETLRRRIKKWKKFGYGVPPEPVWFSDHEVRFRIDELFPDLPNTWLERFKNRQAEEYGVEPCTGPNKPRSTPTTTATPYRSTPCPQPAYMFAERTA